jgi:hypothetical protein
MFFVGIDWSEQHHDVCVLDELGAQRATLRIPEGIVGVARFHELAAQLGCAPPMPASSGRSARSSIRPGLTPTTSPTEAGDTATSAPFTR